MLLFVASSRQTNVSVVFVPSVFLLGNVWSGPVQGKPIALRRQPWLGQPAMSWSQRSDGATPAASVIDWLSLTLTKAPLSIHVGLCFYSAARSAQWVCREQRTQHPSCSSHTTPLRMFASTWRTHSTPNGLVRAGFGDRTELGILRCCSLDQRTCLCLNVMDPTLARPPKDAQQHEMLLVSESLVQRPRVSPRVWSLASAVSLAREGSTWFQVSARCDLYDCFANSGSPAERPQTWEEEDWLVRPDGHRVVTQRWTHRWVRPAARSHNVEAFGGASASMPTRGCPL